MSEPSDADRFAEVMAYLTAPPSPAKSLFLPLVPRRKFPPPDRLSLPRLVLVRVATDLAIQAILPFEFNEPAQGLSSRAEFHAFIAAMAGDKTNVIKIQVTIALEGGVDTSLRLEFCFASRLLSRLQAEWGSIQDMPYFYHILADLLFQGTKNADALLLSTDEDGNYWLRLRNTEGYRPRAFFADVTILVHNIHDLVRVVFAERDDDIEAWYRYEWMSPIVKDILFEEGLPTPIGGTKQAVVFGRFLEKFSKFLAEKPR